MSASTDVIVAAQALAEIQAICNANAGGEPAQLAQALTQIANFAQATLTQLAGDGFLPP
jgi:hypothetical protein